MLLPSVSSQGGRPSIKGEHISRPVNPLGSSQVYLTRSVDLLTFKVRTDPQLAPTIDTYRSHSAEGS